jgi:hypothetical protein
MIIATSLALLPVAFVAVMATRGSRPWWRQLQQLRALPEPGIDRIGRFPNDLAGATEAYAAYLNAPRGVLDSEEQVLFDEDLARARAAMERAWLEATPIQEVAQQHAPRLPAGGVQRVLAVLHGIARVLGSPLSRRRARSRSGTRGVR